MAKQWFYIIQQEEFEMLRDNYQLLVYGAIKSYCANGKREYGISIRDIAKRAKVSTGKVFSTIPELIALRLVEVIGETNKRGGKVSIFKVFTTRTLNPAKRSQGEQLNDESVHHMNESVHGVDIKCTPIKVKSNKEAQENNLSKGNTTGNAEKNTKVGLPKEPTPGFGGLHWSEFADKLSDYHFSKEATKK